MKLDRRSVLVGGASLWGAGCSAPLDLQLSPDASYDEVLEALLVTELEFGAFSNHGPMVADALVASGEPQRVATWVEQYGTSLLLRKPAGPLPLAERAAALGNFEQRAAWIATWEEAMRSLTPRELLVREWPTLGPGLVGALWHGLLRTAHAVRGLERADTDIRRRELAQGLGYWASRFQPLPGTPGARATAGLDVGQALARVPLVPVAERTRGGVVERQLDVLRDRADFIDAVEAVDLDAISVDGALTELVAAASRLFVNEGKHSILLLHAITGTSVLRLLLPWLDASMQRQAVGFAFQAVAGAHAIWSPSPAALDPIAPPTQSPEALFARAAQADDAHHIKLGEAGRRESPAGEHPDVLTALERWLA